MTRLTAADAISRSTTAPSSAVEGSGWDAALLDALDHCWEHSTNGWSFERQARALHVTAMAHALRLLDPGRHWLARTELFLLDANRYTLFLDAAGSALTGELRARWVEALVPSPPELTELLELRYDFREAEAEYLRDFDFRYRLRRLLFLRHKVDDLQRLCATVARSCRGTQHDPLAELQKRLDRRKLRRRLAMAEGNGPGVEDGDAAPPAIGMQDIGALSEILRVFKKEIDQVCMAMRKRAPDLWARPRSAGEAGAARGDDGAGHVERLCAEIGALKLEPKHLDYILGVPWEVASGQSGCRDHLLEFGGGDEASFHARIDSLFEDPGFGLPGLQAQLDAVGAAMRDCLKDIRAQSKRGIMEILEGRRVRDSRFPPALVSNVLLYLGVYYRHFEHYDQIRFPILYETDVGEADVVEVIRISPEDATSLVDADNAPKKLAGTALRNFGAFLETSWRKNDIMWGRLDGAERLIVALLPAPEDEPIRKALLREAQIAILTEELSEQSISELSRSMTDAILARMRSGESLDQAFSATIQGWRDRHTDDLQLDVLQSSSQYGDKLIEYVRANYAVNRELAPDAMLRLMSRTSQIMGKMFESMAQNYPVGGGGMRWLARLARLAWGMVEIAIPQSLVNLLFRHWIKLIYACQVFLLVLFFALSAKDALMITGLVFGGTLLLHIAVLAVGDLLRRRKGAGFVSMMLLLIVVVGFAFIGVDRLIADGPLQVLDEILGVQTSPENSANTPGEAGTK